MPRYEVSPALQRGRQLCEAVISPSSPLVGQAVRDADFRALYDAAIVAVHRNGARLTNKIGDVRLHAGDTLLLQVGPELQPGLPQQPRLLPGQRRRGLQPRPPRPGLAAAIIFLVMIAAFVSGKVDIMLAALLAAGAMVAASAASRPPRRGSRSTCRCWSPSPRRSASARRWSSRAWPGCSPGSWSRGRAPGARPPPWRRSTSAPWSSTS